MLPLLVMIGLQIKNIFFKFVKYSLIFIAFVILIFILLLSYTAINKVPDDKALQYPEIKESSTLLDSKGRYIGIYINEYRNTIEAENINPWVKKSVIAAEDVRFYDHNGIDFRAMIRVAIKSILLGDKDSGGGSTITQQLAKQLYPRPKLKGSDKMMRLWSLIQSKMKEWLIARKLEKHYRKDAILAMYLNKFEFVNGAYGIDAAALTYFGKHQDSLSLSEAATLAGMLKNPSLYNPVRNPDLVQKRRNEVLDKMNLPDIKKEKENPVDFSKFKRFSTSDTIVPYFKASLVAYLEKLIRTQNLVKPDGNYYDIYADGLIIESTIDLDMQRYAETATRDHMAWIQGWFDKDWTNEKPWDYQVGEQEKSMRYAVIRQKVRMSPRYEAIKKRILNPVLNKLNVTLSDQEIDLINAGNKQYVESKVVSENLKKVVKSPYFVKIKHACHQLETEVKQAFDTPVKMNIFDIKHGQRKVEMTPLDSVKYHLMLLQTALVAIDPLTGYVKCWNGGLDYRYFNLDHTIMRRSIGSTAKPFVYTLAMTEKQIKPCDEFVDTVYTIYPGEGDFKNKEPWSPQNATKANTKLKYNLYHGLMYSKNTITVRLLKELGSVKPLIDLWDKMGISKEEKLPNGRLAVPEWPSIGLGAIDITLLQLTSAYTTFANQGKWQKPILVKSIKNKKGELIYEAKQQPNPVMMPLYNAIMLDMLINNESHDFSMHLESQNGGKTGTTDDQSDGWYVGLTPNLVVGIWTGGDEKWIRFLREDVGQGFFTARPLFEKFIRNLEKDTSGIYDVKAKFADPPNGFNALTNCSKKKTGPIPEASRSNHLADY